MKLNARSEKNLIGVHPDLISIIKSAADITALDFIVTEGVRTMKRQKELVAKGASQTLKSRHIPECNSSGMSCAVDLAVLVSGQVRWDWPLYEKLSVSIKLAANVLNIPLEWGGDWKSFKDGPHYQLPWATHP